MSNDNRNLDFPSAPPNSEDFSPPSPPYDPYTSGYYDNSPGYFVPQYPGYPYAQGSFPVDPAPHFPAPAQYDAYGNPFPYGQDPIPLVWPETTNPYADYTYPPQSAYYAPAAGASPYPSYPQPYAPHPPTVYSPLQQMPQPASLTPASPDSPSGEFARKFAQAAAQTSAPSAAEAQVTERGLDGFGQLAEALESKLTAQARQHGNWPPKKAADPPKNPIPAPKDVFDEPSVSLDRDKLAAVPSKQPPVVPDNNEVARIAQNLSRSVLLKSYNRSFNDNNLLPEGDAVCIDVEGTSSNYYISVGGASAYPMYHDVSFRLCSGSCCALVSDVSLSTYVLARAIAENADAGHKDRLQVGETADGHSGKVFYIGGSGMLPRDMTCEEFLLYTMACRAKTTRADYDQLSVLLSQIGMSNIQETVLTDLSNAARTLLLVLAAALNPRIVCIIVNDPHFQIGAEEEMMARRIFALACNRGKSCLLASCSPALMAAVANRVAVFKHGQFAFFGEYKRFLNEYCLGMMSFTVSDPLRFPSQFEHIYPGITAVGRDKLIYLIRRSGFPEPPLETLLRDIITLGADYNTIVMDEKSFAGACKEVLGS